MLFCNNGFPVGDSKLSSVGTPGSKPRWQFYASYTLTENISDYRQLKMHLYTGDSDELEDPISSSSRMLA